MFHSVPCRPRPARLRPLAGAALALCAGLWLAACGERTPPRPAFVAVSVPPLGALVSMVAGPGVPVKVFLPGNQNAHDFEPSPGDAARLAGARLVVTADPRLDPWMARAARAVAGSGVPVLTMGTGEAKDPHLWLDPPAVIAFVPELAAGLARAFPERAEDILARGAEAQRRLAAADTLCARTLAPAGGRPFALQLPAFVNFARHYELRSVAVIQTCPEEEPTPGAFARAAAELRETGGRVVFSHRGANPAAAGALALEVGGRVVELDPFGSGDADLAALWTANAITLAEALIDAGD